MHGCLTAMATPPTLTGMTRLILALTLLIAMAWPASADWAMTRWGMTPAEVADATDGVAAAIPLSTSGVAGGNIAAMGMTHTEDGVTYDVRLSFGRLGLNRVDLWPRADMGTFCYVLFAHMAQECGAPASTDQIACWSPECEPDARVYSWFEPEDGDMVSLFMMEENGQMSRCGIGYRDP